MFGFQTFTVVQLNSSQGELRSGNVAHDCFCGATSFLVTFGWVGMVFAIQKRKYVIIVFVLFSGKIFHNCLSSSSSAQDSCQALASSCQECWP